MRLLAVLFVVLLGGAAAGCGSSADTGSSGSSGSSGGAPATEGPPQRIVSLSPAATEILYAVGAGDQVVAVDDQSNYPEGVPTTDLSGYTPNVEAILGYEPDLVVFAEDPGDLRAGLERVGVHYLQLQAPTGIDGTYDQIEQVGIMTGHEDEARDVVGKVRGQIADAVDTAGDAGKGLTYYHELDPTNYTVTGESFIGQVYSLFGLENIADAAEGSSAYPQLQAEYVVSANPDLIFLADTECCGATVESVSERPGWSQVNAVEDGRIYSLNADVTSRWGPRIGDLAERIAAILTDGGGGGQDGADASAPESPAAAPVPAAPAGSAPAGQPGR